MLKPIFRPSLLLLFLHVLVLLAGQASAAPLPISPSQVLVPRADGNLDGPVTVTTVRHTDTSSGTVTETCIITLTPQTDPDGKQVTQEVKKCSVTVAAAGGQGGSSSKTPPSNTTSQQPAIISPTTTAATSSADPSPPPSSPVSPANSTAATPSPPPSSPVSPANSTAATPSALSVNGISLVTPSAASTTATSTTSTTSTSPTTSVPPATTSGTQDKNGGSSSPPSNSPSGTNASASAEQTSSAAFAVGGKKLSVLPIGLGVFAGISVIALIVVGLVTYERTKYRKAFRQRKLAEAGAAPGYGGMADRI